MPRQRKRIEHPERKRLRKSAMVVDSAGIGIASAGLILQTTGAVALRAPPAPPADGGLNNSTVSFWLDETRNNLKVTREVRQWHSKDSHTHVDVRRFEIEKRTGADAPVAGGTPALPSRRPAARAPRPKARHFSRFEIEKRTDAGASGPQPAHGAGRLPASAEALVWPAGGTPALPGLVVSIVVPAVHGLDRGRESVSAPPPSEPDVRISRIRLSS